MGSYMRSPKTHNEMVANCRDKEYVRGRRRIHNLVTSWDDIKRFRCHSWKRNSKNIHQYGNNCDKINNHLEDMEDE